MSQDAVTGPNAQVRDVYDRLGSLLDRGDEVFIEEGPGLLQAAIAEPGFFDGVEPAPADSDHYTREKVAGAPGGHVIRFMEWPPGYSLVPHEHHGRPCFEVLVDGLLHVVDMTAEQVDEEHYTLSILDCDVTEPGEAAVVDPRENDIHAVYSPVRSCSLHVYPDDRSFAYGYELDEDASDETDLYRRERFELHDG
ncbi:hypothetical protein [Haloarchaeobius sp. DYHT-AS-18]|uniref:hypothetical protein n=1 Tax=Haloarchaeobius sp. DYHT-AS-18 TaxID=3446117 RepID=UPI003EB8D2FB